jgi:hypothetical protein
MRRFGLLGAGLLAVWMALALAASGASAAPSWWACEKAAPKNTGHYSDKACTVGVPSGGRYELQPGVGRAKSFKGKSAGSARLTVVVPGKIELKIECGALKESGRAATPNREVGVTLAFSKCAVQNFHEPCASFTTAPMSGELGWIDEEAGLVGVSLTSEAAPNSGLIAQIECPGLSKLRIHGAFIGKQTGDVRQLSRSSTTTWEVRTIHTGAGFEIVNTPAAFEGGPDEVLLTEFNDVETHGAWEPEGGLPSGLEGAVPTMGENLLIQ